ncbi:MAG: hypothetical protein PVSMB7_26790 [Chloroflexota bacterium]
MKTRHILPLLTTAALSAGILFPPTANARTGTKMRVETSVPVTFHLQIAGTPTKSTTFWVAWGPSGGGFGIVQLHRSGRYFTADHRFPVGARVGLSYIEGHGVMSTRFGPAPGNPVRTIRTLAPTSAAQLTHAVVRYQSPVG